MSNKVLRKKYGIVVLLDALGASEYSDEKIKEFLSARKELNDIVKYLSSKEGTKPLGDIGVFHSPEIFTFGDTVIITIPLKSKKYRYAHLYVFTVLMKRYLFYSMQKGILFRGSFSIGNYFADSATNTVMGEAVTDAAAWYEESDWMGLSSTPATNTVLEFLVGDSMWVNGLKDLVNDNFSWLHKYDVPLKGGKTRNLYTINWVSVFLDDVMLKRETKKSAELYFLEIMKNFKIPKGTEEKYLNIKKYFDYMKALNANKSSKPTTKNVSA